MAAMDIVCTHNGWQWREASADRNHKYTPPLVAFRGDDRVTFMPMSAPSMDSAIGYLSTTVYGGRTEIKLSLRVYGDPAGASDSLKSTCRYMTAACDRLMSGARAALTAIA